ncbi:MAG: LysM peptidoglycan-binding domain-containing protein [Mycobacterium sp.]
MTLIHTVSPRTGDTRRPINTLAQAPRYDRERVVRARRPASSRPADLRTRYHGTGVAMSTAPHRRRPVPMLTTVGLALLAGVITLWLGLVANLGQLANGDSGGSAAAAVPDKLAVVRVEAGESLQDVAHRVAPDAPTRQVADRIRELNDLNSPALAAGQTLIAPVG